MQLKADMGIVGQMVLAVVKGEIRLLENAKNHKTKKEGWPRIKKYAGQSVFLYLKNGGTPGNLEYHLGYKNITVDIDGVAPPRLLHQKQKVKKLYSKLNKK